MRISDTALLAFKISLEGLIMLREMMIAENMQRQYQGAAMAYVEDAFADVQIKMTELMERLRKELKEKEKP